MASAYYKRWSQTVTALRKEYPHVSVEELCSLFGKSRQWYYKKPVVAVSEQQRRKLIEEHIDFYRGLMPRIGGVKLYELVREEIVSLHHPKSALSMVILVLSSGSVDLPTT